MTDLGDFGGGAPHSGPTDDDEPAKTPSGSSSKGEVCDECDKRKNSVHPREPYTDDLCAGCYLAREDL